MVGAVDLLYRALYRGVLARMPERAAIAIGQWGLRHVPLDRLGLFRNEDPRLAITLGGVTLPNPLILSSMYYDTAILRRAMGLGWGAVTAKSITPGPRPGHPEPNLVRIETAEGPGLVNCNGFKNPGLEAYRRGAGRAAAPRPAHRGGGGRIGRGLRARGRGPPGVRRPRRDQHLLAQHQAGLRLVHAARRAEGRLPGRPGGHPQAGDRQDLARFPRDQRGDHDPGRPRRRHHHRQLRQYPPRRGAAPVAALGRALRPRPLRRPRSRTCAGCASASATASSSSPPGASTAPRRARQALAAGATACGIFTGFITRGPLLARRILDALPPAGK